MNVHEWQAELFPPQSGRGWHPTLCDICLDLRASFSGQSDPWPVARLREVTAMLEERLLAWTPCRDTTDALVLAMVHEAIRSANLELVAIGGGR